MDTDREAVIELLERIRGNRVRRLFPETAFECLVVQTRNGNEYRFIFNESWVRLEFMLGHYSIKKLREAIQSRNYSWAWVNFQYDKGSDLCIIAASFMMHSEVSNRLFGLQLDMFEMICEQVKERLITPRWVEHFEDTEDDEHDWYVAI